MARRNLAKERARHQVASAIAAGTLVRPECCEQCGAVLKRPVHAHHISYSRPLDVLWLCPGCHARAHSPRPPRPGSARQRVEAELRANPRRSDAIIASLARCTQQATGRWRRQLEQAGVIEHVEPAQRASIPRTWKPRAPRLAIEQGATSTAEVMQLSGVSYGTAWRALDRARSKPRLADAAAACDTLSVVRTQPARSTRLHVGSQLPAGYYAEPDPIELMCCTAEYVGGQFVHDRACAVRLAAR